MKDNSPWLFVEPYVHLLRQDDTLLVYNTVSKTVLEFDLTNKLSKLTNELADPANGYVVSLSPDLLIDPSVQEFINQLRSHFMGDLLDPSWSEGKPVNIIPEPIVKHGLHPPRREASAMQSGLDLRNYLQEMTLYLNSGPGPGSNPFLYAGLQFSYPDLLSEKETDMDINLFRSLIDNVNQYTPTLIHISGINLISYPYLEQAIEHLTFSPFQKKYHLLINHWEDQITPFILAQKNSGLALYITFPTPPEAIARHLERLPDQKLLKKTEFNFVVSNQEELDAAFETIRILDLTNVYFKPHYSGENLDFFRENVFVSREEILASQPDQQQVFSRNSINENDFGKLSILPGGEVFANMNDAMIGNAATHTLADLVSEELENGISWKRTRKGVSPCSGCIYQFLCPPISSYEIFMQRFNFCDVYPKGKVS